MRTLHRLVVVSVLVAASAAAQTPQTRPGQATPPPASARAVATGSLRGVVVAGDTGVVLRRARVTLTAPGLRETRATTTDAEGRWEFKNLSAGRFTITAGKPQYVSLEYGQRSPAEPGRPVELTAGQAIAGLDFRLPRGSVIAGRVTDDLGEPAAAIYLQAYRLGYLHGRKQIGPIGVFAITNDLGQYRLAGLPPGTYYVGSSSTIWSGSADDKGISFGETFYPGTLRAADAQPVSLRLGQERPNVDFGLQTVRLATVSGVVIDSQGAPVANSEVLLEQEHQSGTGTTVFTTSGGTTAADGRFTVRNVAPGEYSLASLGTSRSFQVATERGSVDFIADGVDISGLILALHKGSQVSGRIEFDGESRPDVTPAIRIYAAEVGGSHGMSLPGTSTLSPDWSFEIGGVSPGKRQFRVVGLPPTHVLKSVTIDGRDVTDIPTEFDGKSTIDDVVILLTERVTTILGEVADDRGRPVQDYTVVAFARDPERWTPGTRYIETARPDQKGQYSVSGLPPGDYLVVALDYLEHGQAESPEFLSAIKSKATSVALAAGESKALNLKLVIPER